MKTRLDINNKYCSKVFRTLNYYEIHLCEVYKANHLKEVFPESFR